MHIKQLTTEAKQERRWGQRQGMNLRDFCEGWLCADVPAVWVEALWMEYLVFSHWAGDGVEGALTLQEFRKHRLVRQMVAA